MEIFNKSLKKLKSENVSAVFSYMNSNLIVAIVVALASIIQAMFVTPDELGYFRQFGIITNYLFFLHLGTYQGIERLYPFYMGKGEHEKARQYIFSAEAWIFMISVPCIVIFVALTVFSFVKGNWRAGMGWLAQASAVFTTIYGGFIKATYRSGQDFVKLSKAQLLVPFYTAIVIPVYYIAPYVGLFLKNIYLLPSTIIMYIKRPIKNGRKFVFKDFKDVVLNGLPRFTSSYALTTGIEAVRATLVLYFLGQIGLGFWSFTWTIFGLIRQIPQSVSAVYAPKVTQEYGKTMDYKKCFRLCRKPFILCLFLMLAIIPAGIFAAMVLIPWLLPNYAGASSIVAMSICFILPNCLLDLPWQVLNAMNKPVTMNVLAGMDLLTQILVMFVLFKIGLGINSIIVGNLCGTMFRCFGLVYTFVKIKKEG